MTCQLSSLHYVATSLVLIVLLQADPDFSFAVADVVLHLDRAFQVRKADRDSVPHVSLASVVGELLVIEGLSATVHWLDGTESTVPCREVRTFHSVSQPQRSVL